MAKNGLRPRAAGALTVVATSLFLLLCLFKYGSDGVAAATEPALHLRIAGWFVEAFGVGAYALVLLPLAWGMVVYFREHTPSLVMRAVGTVLLACSAAMIAGLLQAPEPGIWAGAVGSFTAALVEWLADWLGGTYGASIAKAGTWLTSAVLFIVSLIWATDWMFHTLRRGPLPAPLPERPQIAVEPDSADFRNPDEDASDRTFVEMPSAGAGAALHLATEPAAPQEPVPVPSVPKGFSAHHDADRVVLRGPVGYQGVEFLSRADELADPDRPEERVASTARVVRGEPRFVDDVYDFSAPAPAASPTEAEPAADSTATMSDSVAETPETPELPAAAPAAGLLALFSSTEPETATETATEIATKTEIEPAAAETAPEREPVETTRPRSGISLPADRGFVDEFFTIGAPTDEAPRGGDGASSAGEVAATYGVATGADESPESREASQAPVTPEPTAAAAPVADAPQQRMASSEAVIVEAMIVDEMIFAPAAYTIIDDEFPAPIAARSAARPTEAPPQSPDEAAGESAPETVAASAVAASAVDLGRLDPAFADPLLHEAVDAVLDAGRSSPMLLQRRFGIGHARGLRLLEQMEDVGVVSPEDDLGNRELRVSTADWEAATGSRTS